MPSLVFLQALALLISFEPVQPVEVGVEIGCRTHRTKKATQA
jgi:hypothetical protein